MIYDLLKNGVDVYWCILPGKSKDDIDFTVSEVADAPSGGNTLYNIGYPGGPFVVHADNYATALPIVQTWQTNYPEIAVHRAITAFDCPVSRHLLVAPTIAIFADDKEDIAFKYLNAAQIPDSLGQQWPDKKCSKLPDNCASYPDVLDEAEVEGPTTTDHKDGALFDVQGYPDYCQFMSMHYDVDKHSPEVVAEVREFLQYRTHFFAECQAVNAFENDQSGYFLTTGGLDIGNDPDKNNQSYYFFNMDSPFAQIHGDFYSEGGSEPSYTLKPGSQYYNANVVNVSMTPTVGEDDVWMNGYVDGDPTKGKVSYLGGHKYKPKLPVSENPKTQGVRFFLNSLFEAPCVTGDGAVPVIDLVKDGPAMTTSDTWTYTITVQNTGTWRAREVTITDDVPAGLTIVSTNPPASINGHTATWTLGTLCPGESTTLEITVQASAPGTYTNTAQVGYMWELTAKNGVSNSVTTKYGLYDIYRDVAPQQVIQPSNMKDVVTSTNWLDPDNVLLDGSTYFYKIAIQGNDGQFPVVLLKKNGSTVELIWY